jgi:hypothetical protein
MSTVLRFFFSLRDPNLNEFTFLTNELRAMLTLHSTSFALFGPRNCGKSSMVWTYAQSVAAEGYKSLLLCVRSAVESKGGAPLAQVKTSSTWSLVDIKYVATVDDAVNVLASVHLMEETPHFIALDDVDSLLKSSTNVAASLAQLFAVMNDARAHCATRIRRQGNVLRDESAKCVTLVCGCGEHAEWNVLLNHWAITLLTIRRFNQPGLKFSLIAAETPSFRGFTVVYSTANSVLSLITAMEG